MNLPNLLTLSRIPILFGIVGLLYLSWPGAATAAFVLFVVGALTDWADGYAARRLGMISNFGKLMDALTDKVFMVGLFITLLVLGILPDWGLPLVLLILSREFLITGLRLVAASSGKVLAAEKSGKQKTVSQIVAGILLLLGDAMRRDWPELVPGGLAAAVDWVGLAFFVLAAVLTVSSGTLYLWKYWNLFTGKEESGAAEEPIRE